MKVPAPITYPLTTPQVPVYGMVRNVIVLYSWKTHLSLQWVWWQTFLCSNHPATYVLFHNVNSVWNMIVFSQCALEEITLNFLQQVFFKSLTLLGQCVCLYVYFLLYLQCKKNVSSRITLNFIYLFCGFFFFLTGTSSDWSCSFDGTPVNDVYTAWSKANKSFCTCFWNSGEMFSLILRPHWNFSLGKSNQMSHEGLLMNSCIWKWGIPQSRATAFAGKQANSDGETMQI